MQVYRVLFYFLIFLLPVTGFAQKNAPEIVNTISFGSCNNQEKPQPMWQFVLQNNPNLWIWLGDNVYADTDDMTLLAKKYAKQRQSAGYQELNKKCEIIGIWDDHDFGLNDGGKDWKAKKGSQREFYNFFGVGPNDPVRRQEGIYRSFTYGENPKKIKVILLDTRYFRDTLEVRGVAREKFCIPNKTGDILGETQWAWLEDELAGSDADINILCSSIQFIPEQHDFEKWANFPTARTRLFKLIQKTQPNHLLILSGDRHIGEISRFDLEGLDYPLYEITSSGMTHTWHEIREEPNRYRLGDLIIRKNFGVLQIKWTEGVPIILAEIRGLGNELFLQKQIEWK